MQYNILICYVKTILLQQYQGAVNPSRDISKIARYKLFATTGKIHSWFYLDLQ